MSNHENQEMITTIAELSFGIGLVVAQGQIEQIIKQQLEVQKENYSTLQEMLDDNPRMCSVLEGFKSIAESDALSNINQSAQQAEALSKESKHLDKIKYIVELHLNNQTNEN